jgi:hypothetical protein
MQKLPIGIQTFSKIREGNYLYIDKTALAYDLIENYQYAFLSRPRRFGKSLFLDTLHNIFEGKKEYFEGLAIYDKWDWEHSYPVIRIDWSGDFKTQESTNQTILKVLQYNQERLGIECDKTDNASNCFSDLIKKSYEKYQKPVVILIDEYDKPILDNLENTQRALENRDFLRSFYVMMKANDAYIKFAFLTGISKFSKANIFSGLNNLTDISLKPKYGNICGYTQNDIETTFLPYLQGVDLLKMKEWYNGYNFLGDKVYNPFDILQFIDNDYLYKNYWWESANPYFLITMLKKYSYNLANLENMTVGDELLNSFDIEKLKLEVLLFQSGYLTIEKQIEKRNRIEYKLKVPNCEVQTSLNMLFIDYLTDSVSYQTQDDIYDALEEEDLQKFQETFISLFASIPYNNYVKNSVGEYEGYYASVFYAYLAATGLYIIAEDMTNSGCIDLSIIMHDIIYILEFKVDATGALEQIEQKKYHQKYLSHNKTIYLLGIEFSSSSKNIEHFSYKKVT